MLHHKTDDPAKRAASIAEREAMAEARKDGNYANFFKTWLTLYKQVLWEFVYEGQI